MGKEEGKVLTCVDCRQEFVFRKGEQRFYEEKGFMDPKRCRPCREEKRRQREEGGASR